MSANHSFTRSNWEISPQSTPQKALVTAKSCYASSFILFHFFSSTWQEQIEELNETPLTGVFGSFLRKPVLGIMFALWGEQSRWQFLFNNYFLKLPLQNT